MKPKPAEFKKAILEITEAGDSCTVRVLFLDAKIISSDSNGNQKRTMELALSGLQFSCDGLKGSEAKKDSLGKIFGSDFENVK